jgi:hypothetical protein
VTGGFTLDQLAQALRGMPRNAPVLLELPDGRLVEIASVRPQHVLVREGAIEGSTSAHGATYGIVLVAATTE